MRSSIGRKGAAMPPAQRARRETSELEAAALAVIQSGSTRAGSSPAAPPSKARQRHLGAGTLALLLTGAGGFVAGALFNAAGQGQDAALRESDLGTIEAAAAALAAESSSRSGPTAQGSSTSEPDPSSSSRKKRAAASDPPEVSTVFRLREAPSHGANRSQPQPSSFEEPIDPSLSDEPSSQAPSDASGAERTSNPSARGAEASSDLPVVILRREPAPAGPGQDDDEAGSLFAEVVEPYDDYKVRIQLRWSAPEPASPTDDRDRTSFYFSFTIQPEEGFRVLDRGPLHLEVDVDEEDYALVMGRSAAIRQGRSLAFEQRLPLPSSRRTFQITWKWTAVLGASGFAELKRDRYAFRLELAPPHR